MQWPQSLFTHIEAGSKYPRVGKLFGIVGLIAGFFPAVLLTSQAGYSIFVKQILDPGLAVINSIVWTGLAMAIAAMSYKFAHECDGSRASRRAMIGFRIAPVAILIAIAYTFIAAWLELEWMMR